MIKMMMDHLIKNTWLLCMLCIWLVYGESMVSISEDGWYTQIWCCLVGGWALPLWKILIRVIWDDEFPNWMEKWNKNVPKHQPGTEDTNRQKNNHQSKDSSEAAQADLLCPTLWNLEAFADLHHSTEYYVTIITGWWLTYPSEKY